MKTILGVLGIILGIALGLYVGVWVFLVGGIIGIVTGIQPLFVGGTILVGTLSIGILKVALASFVGVLSAYLVIIPSYVLMVSDSIDVKRKRRK